VTYSLMSFEEEAMTCSPTMYGERDASFSMYGLVVKMFITRLHRFSCAGFLAEYHLSYQ
jgi:hypothetical protein